MEGKEGARVDFPPRFFRIKKEDGTIKRRYIPLPPGVFGPSAGSGNHMARSDIKY